MQEVNPQVITWTAPLIVTCSIVVSSALVTLIGIFVSFNRTKMQLKHDEIEEWKSSLRVAISKLAHDFTEASFITTKISDISKELEEVQDLDKRRGISNALKELHKNYHSYEKSMTTTSSLVLLYLSKKADDEKKLFDFVTYNYKKFRAYGTKTNIYITDVAQNGKKESIGDIRYDGYRLIALTEKVLDLK